MLRAVGIPSRIVFVDINKEVLSGIVDPRTDYVDHSYSEVYLNGKWIKVDSYIIDTKLYNNSKSILLKTDKRMGWGMHRDGGNGWDGKNDAFSQFVYHDAKNISTKEYGVFDDVGQFYNQTETTWNKSNLIQNVVFFLFSDKMSAEADKIRTKN